MFLREQLRSAMLRASVWAMAVLLAAGCGDDAGDDERGLPAVVAACESESYGACDVLAPECQRRVFSALRCLREMPDAALPPVRSISSEQYRAELEDDVEVSPEDMAESSAVETALGLFGLTLPGELSPEGVVDLYVETVPGYYSNADGTITLIDVGAQDARELEQNTLLLAHELVHALQDQQVSLRDVARATSTFDEYLAATSVIEGEATLLESFFAAALFGIDGQIDFGFLFSSWVESAEAEFADRSPLLVGPRYFPYSYGALYAYGLYLRGGAPRVRAELEDVPRSVLPMMFTGDAGVPLVPESLEGLAGPSSMPPLSLAAEDTLGPWVFSKFLERSFATVPVALAGRWRGDRFFVHASDTGSVDAAWLVRLDAESSAAALESSIGTAASERLSPSAFAVRNGRDVAIGVQTDPATQAAFREALSQAVSAAATFVPSAEPKTNARALSDALRRRMIRARW